MQFSVSPARSVRGHLRLPGDKSISHRYAMLAGVAEGTSRIENYSSGADCQSTLGAVEALGITVERQDGAVLIHGQGLNGLRQPAAMLDAGNSGSTIRMLSGMLAAQPFSCSIGGDASLSRRPMERIMKPLAAMGADIEATSGRFPPLLIRGNKLKPIQYEPPMASAQVKTCVLFAGLHTEGITSVVETIQTRDHSEVALREFGAEVNQSGAVISIQGRPKLHPRQLRVPGDLSSAAFFLVAATLLPGSELTMEGVGLSPSRTALLDWLSAAGANIRITKVELLAGELTGTLVVKSASAEGGVIEGATTAALIDEIPVLAILGAASRKGLLVRDAGELRVKETDRIAAVAENLSRMGVQVEVMQDGFSIAGGQRFRAATLPSFGDHRIAMAFAVAALASEGECVIDQAEAASVSFPEFYDTLRQIRQS
ncbi:MAG: 3-phosphoshikimate 1-carboxyvinyltransferase [Acidobacteriia bacterium]|nr:3-phosphoshikimate 1-carboxyvinyltransferase [Terriglobia bacterium]